MYNLDYKEFGTNLKILCKSKNISLVELGAEIGKSKSTMYKYAQGEIIPDFPTVIEICNVLEIDINDFCSIKHFENDTSKSINPFNTNKLYLYYIGFNSKMLISSIDIESTSSMQKIVFKNVINVKDKNSTAFEYVGTLETDNRVTFISLTNNKLSNKKFEKVLITINMNYSTNDIYMGSIMGTNDANKPTIRKCILSSKLLIDKDEINECFEKLKITQEEKEFINTNNFWDIETVNVEEYSVSVEN